MSLFFKITALIGMAAMLAACAPAAATPEPITVEEPAAARPLRVVATTNILEDVVRQVAGDRVDVQSFIPLSTDPHSYQLTPRDMAMIADADILFMVGAGLEEFSEISVSERTGGSTRFVPLSDGIELLAFEHEGEDEEHVDEEEHEEGDPHVWYDPNNVIVWVQGIERVLVEMDGSNRAVYEANARAYIEQLEGLDAWIREQVAQVPEQNRLILTDHLMLGYFAERYGFRQVGAVVPGYSTMAEPSAREMAALEDMIRDLGVRAVFVGNTVNPQFSQRVAEDTGIDLVYFYTDSLSEAGGPASTYLDYIRYNVTVITEALK